MDTMNTVDPMELQHTYDKANKLAKQAVSMQIARGNTGYLPSLNGVVKSTDIVSELPLGLVEVPLKKIIGTYTHSRSIAFAHNFMPAMPIGSEFAVKWMNLYKIHMDEGIRDPIKVYEYLNWFYVVEGNKRVSVLKFLDAYSIPAQVIRLIPRRDKNNKDICLYYEFLEFNKQTKINGIWFSEKGRYKELFSYLEEYTPQLDIYTDKYKKFMSDIYWPFRKVYRTLENNPYSITTGDAFLSFVKVYGMPKEVVESEITDTMKKFIKEIEVMSDETEVQVKTDQIETPRKRVITSLAGLVTSKKQLKVAFVYAKNPKISGWVYAHELGRLHINNVFGDQIKTEAITDVPETPEAYKMLRALAKYEYDMVFTTSPTFLAPTLKAALEFPKVKFFNCAATHSYHYVTSYFGRIYEAKFLLGMIAGAMTKTNIIGYVAPYPISEVVAGINAFALGVQTVNPHAVVKTMWTDQWDQPEVGKGLAVKLNQLGADIISNEDLPVPGDPSKEYGIYSMDPEDGNSKPKLRYAMPIWDWGIFYEKVIRNILGGTWKLVYEDGDPTQKPMNFWLGMNTGLVDIVYSKTNVPIQVQKMLEVMRNMVMQNEFTPFQGPIYDQKGSLRVANDESAGYEDILKMNWFVQGVEGEIPKIKGLTQEDPLMYMKGLEREPL